MDKYKDVPSQTPQMRPKSEISDPKASRNIPSLLYGNSPRGFFLEGKANLRRRKSKLTYIAAFTDGVLKKNRNIVLVKFSRYENLFNMLCVI